MGSRANGSPSLCPLLMKVTGRVTFMKQFIDYATSACQAKKF